MGAFPRSLFSEQELNATRWYASKHGVSGLPTICQVKKDREGVLESAGLESRTHQGDLGNLYTTNDWKKILEHVSSSLCIAVSQSLSLLQEFSNPLVRPHLQFYPELTDGHLEEACQAERWVREVDANVAGPMARGANGKDYYVNEVAMVNIEPSGEIVPVMTMRWFTEEGVIKASVRRLLISDSGRSFVIDGVNESCMQVPLSAFFLTVKDLQEPRIQRQYLFPPPEAVEGTL